MSAKERPDMRSVAVAERADQMRRANPDLRLGQAMFNALHEIDPVLANTIRGSANDPFYRDERVPEFLRIVAGGAS